MSDLKAKFEKAVADSKTLSERPDNQTLLKLYALGCLERAERYRRRRCDEAVHRADRGPEGLAGAATEGALGRPCLSGGALVGPSVPKRR